MKGRLGQEKYSIAQDLCEAFVPVCILYHPQNPCTLLLHLSSPGYIKESFLWHCLAQVEPNPASWPIHTSLLVKIYSQAPGQKPNFLLCTRFDVSQGRVLDTLTNPALPVALKGWLPNQHHQAPPANLLGCKFSGPIPVPPNRNYGGWGSALQ